MMSATSKPGLILKVNIETPYPEYQGEKPPTFVVVLVSVPGESLAEAEIRWTPTIQTFMTDIKIWCDEHGIILPKIKTDTVYYDELPFDIPDQDIVLTFTSTTANLIQDTKTALRSASKAQEGEGR